MTSPSLADISIHNVLFASKNVIFKKETEKEMVEVKYLVGVSL